MKLTKKIGICMFFLILIIFINNVSALGISPARKVVDFEPGLEDEIELKITNTENKKMTLVIYAEGEFSDLIGLKEYELRFEPGEEFKTIKYKYKLPDKIEVPGDHNVKIVAREVPNYDSIADTSIGASVAVVHQFKIKVPYPGKYVVPDIKVIETGRTDQIDFRIVGENLGTQKIVNAKGIVDIFGFNNEKITTLETELISIEPNERGEFQLTWKGPINVGKYFAKLTMVYDGDVSYSEIVFEVGEKNVEVIDIVVKNFKLGEIARFDILVENRWAEAVDDAFVELIVMDLSEEIGRFKSASEDIPALSKMELTAFWDSAGVEEGEYNFRIILNYDDEKVEKDVRTIVSLNSIKFDFFGTGAVVANSGGVDKMDIMIGALVLLVMINIGWFFYFKKKKR